MSEKQGNFLLCWLVLNQYQHATTNTSHSYNLPNEIVICILIFLPGGGDSNKGKSKKWKRILQFPHISICIDLKEKLGKPNMSAADVTYLKSSNLQVALSNTFLLKKNLHGIGISK